MPPDAGCFDFAAGARLSAFAAATPYFRRGVTPLLFAAATRLRRCYAIMPPFFAYFLSSFRFIFDGCRLMFSSPCSPFFDSCHFRCRCCRQFIFRRLFLRRYMLVYALRAAMRAARACAVRCVRGAVAAAVQNVRARRADTVAQKRQRARARAPHAAFR